jgi:phage shock protein C
MSVRRTKFYLDKRNGKIAGVCAGLADYTGLDLTLMRVFVVLLSILALGPIAVLAYLIIAWLAEDKPRQFEGDSREDEKFWQNVRVRPGGSIRDVRSRFRDIDRRLADLEVYYTSNNSRLANEIDSLR